MNQQRVHFKIKILKTGEKRNRFQENWKLSTTNQQTVPPNKRKTTTDLKKLNRFKGQMNDLSGRDDEESREMQRPKLKGQGGSLDGENGEGNI